MTWPVELRNLVSELIRFRDLRLWQQFHTIKNLVSALAVESGELLELTQWRTAEQLDDIENWPLELQSNFEREVADILIYLLLICDAADIDPIAAAHRKIIENGRKYPIEKARGNAAKYSR